MNDPRTIDEQVATLVMGWKRRPDGFYPSTDPADTFRVVERMIGLGYNECLRRRCPDERNHDDWCECCSHEEYWERQQDDYNDMILGEK